MDDFSKRGLNLVGTTVTNINNDLLGLANVIESQVIPKITKLKFFAAGSKQSHITHDWRWWRKCRRSKQSS